MQNKIKGEPAVILSLEQFSGLMDRIDALEAVVLKLDKIIDNRLIDRSYVMEVTGWSRSTLHKYDKLHSIFQGRKKIPFSHFNSIYHEIFGARKTRPR